MNNVFHKGEHHIQELMSVRQSSDALSSLIQNKIPPIAKDFLEELNFCMVSLNTKQFNLYTITIYSTSSFIEIIDNSTILISLDYRSHIPKIFFEEENLNIGMIGLNFENSKRIRINGKGQIKDNKLKINIDEIYSNCPKYIKKRIFSKNLSTKTKQNVITESLLSTDIIHTISNLDTFFIASSHNEKGVDISHKGGTNGFIKVISPIKLEFVDLPGNNLYNTLGNIYTNPYINIFFIDFDRRNTYQILGKATIEELNIDNKKQLKVIIDCISVVTNTNSFLLIRLHEFTQKIQSYCELK